MLPRFDCCTSRPASASLLLQACFLSILLAKSSHIAELPWLHLLLSASIAAGIRLGGWSNAC